MLDEIEQRIRGPVDILENDDQRTARGEHLDQQAPRGKHLFAVAPLRLRRVAKRDADERREAARILVGVAGGGERVTHVRQHVLLAAGVEQIADQPAQGEERARGAVRQALRGRDGDAATPRLRCDRHGEDFCE